MHTLPMSNLVFRTHGIIGPPKLDSYAADQYGISFLGYVGFFDKFQVI